MGQAIWASTTSGLLFVATQLAGPRVKWCNRSTTGPSLVLPTCCLLLCTLSSQADSVHCATDHLRKMYFGFWVISESEWDRHACLSQRHHTTFVMTHTLTHIIFVLSCSAEADNGLAPALSGIEETREKGELQKAYYGFLHAVTVSNLSHILLQSPSETLHRALTALVAGGAGHVDPGTRKTCLQVWDRWRV